ncbi:collagen alpha-1(I) chain-like [Colius striatus]|uniref:collagen alpha-1(I) chain-like n=1 Tax=Colius striatus TaxID=57412 RepID=UPI002B1D0CD9|nr:collagen alpha-1(I) chain-like [Colius striatus]
MMWGRGGYFPRKRTLELPGAVTSPPTPFYTPHAAATRHPHRHTFCRCCGSLQGDFAAGPPHLQGWAVPCRAEPAARPPPPALPPHRFRANLQRAGRRRPALRRAGGSLGQPRGAAGVSPGGRRGVAAPLPPSLSLQKKPSRRLPPEPPQLRDSEGTREGAGSGAGPRHPSPALPPCRYGGSLQNLKGKEGLPARHPRTGGQSHRPAPAARTLSLCRARFHSAGWGSAGIGGCEGQRPRQEPSAPGPCLEGQSEGSWDPPGPVWGEGVRRGTATGVSPPSGSAGFPAPIAPVSLQNPAARLPPAPRGSLPLGGPDVGWRD